MADLLRGVRRRLAHSALYRSARRWTRWPPVGRVDFGQLRRLRPLSRDWGADRGQPVDRYYIEQFLSKHREDIRGEVLEIGDDRYTRAFGGGRVKRSDVLHLDGSQPGVTIAADLVAAPEIPKGTFDCVICTQTLQFVPDAAAAVGTLHRILRPGGVLLATIPALSRLDSCERNRAPDYWRFTSHGARWLFALHFPPDDLLLEAYGNVLAATAFLQGLAAAELEADELEHRDPAFELLTCVRARKAPAGE